MSDINKLKKVREALRRARELHAAYRKYKVDAIYQFVRNVNGDWLENWSYDDTSS